MAESEGRGILGRLGVLFGKGRPPETSSPDDYIKITVNEPNAQLAEAIDQARRTLEGWLERLAEHPERHVDYAVKAGFPTSQGVEYLWVTPVDINDVGMKGFLMDPPRFLKGKRQWSKVSVTYQQIVDWSIREGDKLYGHFSTRVLLAQNPDLDTDFGSGLSDTPLPPNFPTVP